MKKRVIFVNNLTYLIVTKMTPFVIRLKDEEVDELMNTIIKMDKQNAKNEVLTHDELIVLTQLLLHQNNNLIKLFKKLEPLSALNL